MKTLSLILLSCCLSFSVFSQTAPVLYLSKFFRLNDTDFKIHSYFHSGSGSCYSFQKRVESVQNDTVFLKLVFETRFPVNANGCQRLDTMTQTIIGSGINYVNVSTGIITYNEIDPNVADTLWGMYDSTFTAVLDLPNLAENDFQLYYKQQQLSVKGAQPIESIQLIDLSGKELYFQQGNQLDVSMLSSGVYLLRVFSATGAINTIRWYKE